MFNFNFTFMNFRKMSFPNHSPIVADDSVLDTERSFTESYDKEGSTYKVVEFRKVTQSQLLDETRLPSPSDYSLEVMLKNGYKPTEVPVKGLLDSLDPTDEVNINVVDSSLSKLASIESSSKSAPVENVDVSNDSKSE